MRTVTKLFLQCVDLINSSITEDGNSFPNTTFLFAAGRI